MPEVEVVVLRPSDEFVDLYVLGQSKVFLGNCVSSYSSFVRRERDVLGKKTVYFGLPLSGNAHEEL